MQRVAIIGAGYIAHEHLKALRGLSAVDVVGVCDLSPTIAEAAAEEFGIAKWYTDHRQLLTQLAPDVVHVTTPPRSHVPLALDALRAGSHVLVEKPIATSRDDFAKLRSAASESGRLLFEDYNYLFNPSVQRICDLIARGEFGEVVHVDAQFCVGILGAGSKHADRNAQGPFHGLPGGAIADFVTHLAYLSHAFIGEHRSVHNVWLNRSGDDAVPFDEFRALVEGRSGTACIGFSSHAQPEVFSLRVQGTRMRATASLFEPLLSIERLHDGPRPLLPVRNGLAVAGAHARCAIAGLWGKLQGKPGAYAGLWELLRRLYHGLEHGAEPPVTLAQMDAVNRLVHDILDSAEQT